MSYILDTNIGSKVVHINSENKHIELQTGENSYFQLFLQEAVKCPLHHSMLISLHSATIPYSFYNIRDGINNNIPFVYDSSNHSATITPGNYTTSTLITEMESKITTSGFSGLSITFNRTTMKFQYSTKDGSDTNKFKFDFSQGESNANIELGFSENETTSLITHGTALVSTNVVDVNGSIHGIFIRTNLSNDGSYDSLTKGFSTILARVPIDTNFGGVLFYNPQSSTHKTLISQKEVHTLTIRLTDERNRLVSLNGLNFSMSIQFDFIANRFETAPPKTIRDLQPVIVKKKKKKEYHLKQQKEKERFK